MSSVFRHGGLISALSRTTAMTERSSRSRGDAEGEGVIGIDTRGQRDSPCLAERTSRARRSIEKFRVYASFALSHASGRLPLQSPSLEICFIAPKSIFVKREDLDAAIVIIVITRNVYPFWIHRRQKEIHFGRETLSDSLCYSGLVKKYQSLNRGSLITDSL
jgi:hypothetical protein